ncbi:MAG TPA: TauD/TfdA family dioxygenase [Micromonosporaceae bacterium]|nr:TauD/TfdA family dioxygenase [Micromonosporaceae bacterium]
MKTAVEAAKEDLAVRGWAVLRGLPFISGRHVDEDRVVELASMFGAPSTREGERAVWPVTPRTSRSDATFSVRAGKAGLHTDAQYRQDPEDLVGLFVVRPAADGGHTRLLRAADAVTAVERHPRGQQVLRTLAEPRWSWTTPEVFTAEAPFRAAVLSGGRCVRWRADNLAPTLDADQVTAAAVFEECTETADSVAELRLGPADFVVIDNYRTLHARTAFRDTRRLLLRIRLWAHP